MAAAIIQASFCRQLCDVVAMAVEAEREPAGFGGQLSERLQDAKLMGVGQCAQGAGGECGLGFRAVPLATQSPPGLELRTNWLGVVRQWG
jgi:hypothetical protein